MDPFENLGLRKSLSACKGSVPENSEPTTSVSCPELWVRLLLVLRSEDKTWAHQGKGHV